MAYRKVDDTSLSSVADAIREKGGTSDTLVFPDGFVTAIEAIKAGGGGGSSVVTKDVNFYDYDGTLLYSYTLEEAQALTELPALPTREGLTCQGWNYDLATIKSYGRKVNIGATYITDDGTTRIYIKLEDGRTSPMLGVCPNGTVDVDWGDGTAHDTLTGTSTSTVKWTPTHNYASAGEFVIKLTVTGSMGFYVPSNPGEGSGILRYSSIADTRNNAYQNAVQKVEIGNSVTSIGAEAFEGCYSLSSIVIPNSVTSIRTAAFAGCYSMAYYDFTSHTSVPTLDNTDAFNDISADCQIRVPAALYDEWIAATNWSTYASKIVGV